MSPKPPLGGLGSQAGPFLGDGEGHTVFRGAAGCLIWAAEAGVGAGGAGRPVPEAAEAGGVGGGAATGGPVQAGHPGGWAGEVRAAR